MTMQSCLDLEPKTQLADTNYWKSPEHFKLFATQFYGWSADFRWLDDSQHADIRSDLFAGSTVNIYSNGTNSIPSSDKQNRKEKRYHDLCDVFLQSCIGVLFHMLQTVKRFFQTDVPGTESS